MKTQNFAKFLRKIERKWQKKWEEARIFEANPNFAKPKYFITVAYPYPNSPQHIGHGRTYTMADVHARYKRMRGYNVLLPMAFHYTGTPVLSMAKRLAENDEGLINDFLNVYKISENKLKKLCDPITMAHYFHREIKKGMKEIGYSIDWRREFTTIDPTYSRFIEWQFQKLRQRGYIICGKHPVGWCPKDGNPVGQHDTEGDVEPEIGEFTLIKFRQNHLIFPTATLRPETVFGVTNIWVNPQATYVKATVDNEQWVISLESVEKLRHANHEVTVLATFKGETLIGQCVENPKTTAMAPILPASFVDPKNATGVVMSVPGHAPYDYVALKNLQDKPEKLSVPVENLDKIVPISVIDVPGYTNIPAEELVKKTGITDQTDPKLEAVTKELYRHEFHNGTMNKNATGYSGLPAAEAKEKVKRDMINENKATIMYELVNRPVFCRCGTECIVKLVENQWFIDYGNQEWKQTAHKNLDNMAIKPEDLRSEFNNVIDWLHEKACVRRSGLGTHLPWDREWVIESLSDSTIYMAYYTIARQIKEAKIKPEQLTPAVFDYVFLGEENADELAKTKISQKTLDKMREEFVYFYPLDSRHSGRDLVSNHLTFMLFNHTAIFPEELWPRQIVTNGSVMMEGSKMSKSFGNIIPLREGLKRFGADPIRLSVVATAELLQDAEFRFSIAKAMCERLEQLYLSAVDITKQPKTTAQPNELTQIDRWMLSRLQKHIRKATETMDNLEVRKAMHSTLFDLEQDLQWYKRRSANRTDEKTMNYVLSQVLNVQIRMLAPVAPHFCEELWEMIGGENFVSLADWPKADDSYEDVVAEENETVIKNVLDDSLNIMKTTGIKPKRICYYTASSWKQKVYLTILEKTITSKTASGVVIRELMSDNNLRAKADQVVKFATRTIKDVTCMPLEQKQKRLNLKNTDEYPTLNAAKDFLEQELRAEISIFREEDPNRYDPKEKAAIAKPYRPAIFIEPAS
jgi:leucyl-tRNA synthetase